MQMLGTSEKKMMSTAISSTANQWPQNSFMASSSSTKQVNNNGGQLGPPPLKCPRCDSSNTKFCYYNNYSLSQPRHFCKACKRYWTRGGTLRNVPVGGGCRRNKRTAKRQQTTSSNGIAAVSAATINPSVQLETDLRSANSSHVKNPLLYSNPSLEVNFPFSRLINSTARASFDHQPGIGLGFSSGISSTSMANEAQKNSTDYEINGEQIYFGSSAFASTSTTMASLLASSLQQQRFVNNGGLKDIQNEFPGLTPYEDHIQAQNGSEIWKENTNQIEQINSSLLWNSNDHGGSWFDP